MWWFYLFWLIIIIDSSPWEPDQDTARRLLIDYSLFLTLDTIYVTSLPWTLIRFYHWVSERFHSKTLPGRGVWALFLECKGSCGFSALWDGPSRGPDAVPWDTFPLPITRDGLTWGSVEDLYTRDIKALEEHQRLESILTEFRTESRNIAIFTSTNRTEGEKLVPFPADFTPQQTRVYWWRLPDLVCWARRARLCFLIGVWIQNVETSLIPITRYFCNLQKRLNARMTVKVGNVRFICSFSSKDSPNFGQYIICEVQSINQLIEQTTNLFETSWIWYSCGVCRLMKYL